PAVLSDGVAAGLSGRRGPPGRARGRARALQPVLPADADQRRVHPGPGPGGPPAGVSAGTRAGDQDRGRSARARVVGFGESGPPGLARRRVRVPRPRRDGGRRVRARRPALTVALPGLDEAPGKPAELRPWSPYRRSTVT